MTGHYKRGSDGECLVLMVKFVSERLMECNESCFGGTIIGWVGTLGQDGLKR